MRPLLHGDLIETARALEMLAPEQRGIAVGRWLDEAHAADLFRKRTGRAHPIWGNGSLLARVICEPRAPDRALGAGYLRALGEVSAALIDWRGRAQGSNRRSTPFHRVGLPLCRTEPM